MTTGYVLVRQHSDTRTKPTPKNARNCNWCRRPNASHATECIDRQIYRGDMHTLFSIYCGGWEWKSIHMYKCKNRRASRAFFFLTININRLRQAKVVDGDPCMYTYNYFLVIIGQLGLAEPSCPHRVGVAGSTNPSPPIANPGLEFQHRAGRYQPEG